ncbi:MAG: hypothetical protein QF718_10170 [Phycisphaerales bacterium]|nr:hypothetical protein [Phycisphaerales bacterium]
MITQIITKTVSCCALLTLIGCGSNWRTHDSQQLSPRPMFNEHAPEWVQGVVPQSDGRIYFVGRSAIPDVHRLNIENTEGHRTPNQRVGYTVMDEREAVQSARSDIHDQIRQRLTPRNMGDTTNLMVGNIDSGTCVTCGTAVPIIPSTRVIVCNDDCKHMSSHCSGGSRGTLSVFPTSSSNGKHCGDCHKEIAHCAGCGTLVHSLTQSNRTPDYVNSGLSPLARDLNIINVSLSSVMPALAAYLTEEEVYFEKWHVHEGHDGLSRPFANGRDVWQSYKCWMLCSIPAEEFYNVAEDFRTKYEDMYSTAIDRADQDRARRIAAEESGRDLTVARQDEERAWNREDEIVTRQHTIELDKDRHGLPGRRFTLENE